MQIPNFTKEHIDAILSKINLEAICNRKFKIAIDMINASACVIDPYFFEKMNVELVPLNNKPNGKFTHKPEPLKENLGDIEKLVKESGADLGFVQDPDADRLVLIDEKGNMILEEYTLALAIENILSKNPGKNVVINLSSSKTSVDITEKYNGKCFFSKVGELNVVKKMIEKDAIIGGEGSGGIIFPAINMARDSFVGIALILELLAERKTELSTLVENLPKYFIKKAKWPLNGDLVQNYDKLKEHFKESSIIDIDGLRLDFVDNSWIHIRPSNTEPIFRLFGEAKTQERIETLFEETRLTLSI